MTIVFWFITYKVGNNVNPELGNHVNLYLGNNVNPGLGNHLVFFNFLLGNLMVADIETR